MTTTMRFCVLDVGQGTGTLVQSIDPSGTPTFSALIDLGSEGWKEEAGENSARIVAQELSKRPVLDAVFLSHSDSDHINLVPSLLKYFVKPGQPGKALSVRKVWFGGDPDKYFKKTIGKNILTTLDEYHTGGGSVRGTIGNAETSWQWNPPRVYAEGGGINIKLLVGNTAAEYVQMWVDSPVGRTPTGGYVTNTKSLVLVVTLGSGAAERRIIATGDATALTLAKCVEVIWAAHGINLAPCWSVTLPHHGSETTTYDLQGISTAGHASKELPDYVIAVWSNYVQPQTLSASAGERSTFRHPAIRVIRDFGHTLTSGSYIDPALPGSGEHFYTSFFPGHFLHYQGSNITDWPSKAGWHSVRSGKDVFTTDYVIDPNVEIPVAYPPDAQFRNPQFFNPRPPRAIAWDFRVFDDGSSPKILPAFDRMALEPEQVERLEEAMGRPLPPERFFFVPSAEG